MWTFQANFTWETIQNDSNSTILPNAGCIHMGNRHHVHFKTYSVTEIDMAFKGLNFRKVRRWIYNPKSNKDKHSVVWYRDALLHCTRFQRIHRESFVGCMPSCARYNRDLFKVQGCINERKVPMGDIAHLLLLMFLEQACRSVLLLV